MMATVPYDQSRAYDTRTGCWRNVGKIQGPVIAEIDYWMPLCDGCGRLKHDSDWMNSSYIWRCNLMPRIGVTYQGYRRPFRNTKWQGYRCEECIEHHWPEINKMLPRTQYCSMCLKSYQWKYEWAYFQVCHHCQYRDEYNNDRADAMKTDKKTDKNITDCMVAIQDRGLSHPTTTKRKVFIQPRSRLVETTVETYMIEPMDGNTL